MPLSNAQLAALVDRARQKPPVVSTPPPATVPPDRLAPPNHGLSNAEIEAPINAEPREPCPAW